MTKHDWFWVAVKVGGLAMMLSSLWALSAIVTVLGDMSFGRVLLRLLIDVGAVGVVGVWMIRDGSMLTDWARDSDRSSTGPA